MAGDIGMGGPTRASTKLAVFLSCALAAGVAPGAAGARRNPPPRPPTNPRVSAAQRTLRLSWNAPHDSTGVTGYYLYRGTARVSSVKRTTRSYTFQGLRCGRSYVVGVAAHAATGVSSHRAMASGRTKACIVPVSGDTQAPTAPSSLAVTSSSGSSVAVAWNAATDNVGVAGYNVYLAGVRVGTTSTTAFTFVSLSCAVSYELAVEAFDAVGNISTRATIQARTAACPDTQAPAAPSDFHVAASTAGSLALAWTAAADNVGVTGYNLYLTGVLVAAVTGTTHTLTGLGCNVAYSLAIEAVDAAGNVSGRATLLASTAACPDTQPPTAPSDLRVTGSSGDSLTLAWSLSTDNVGIAGYHLYVPVPGGASVTTTAANATLTGLTCGTSYGVVVEAADAAGNVSGRATLTDWTDLCPTPPASGGTLRVDLTSDFDFTDPALDYFAHGWQMQYATGLKLYNYPDAPAPLGSTLVHEAAAGFPLVTDGGKTYTFIVKPGFKFSDGTPVTAANFAYAINRDLQPQMVSPAIDFMRDIVGAQDVIDGKAATASGVQVDGNKLIIKLVQPAGDFTARLSMPFFQAVKTDMPITPNGVTLPITAGPYHVTAWAPKISATLQRNPFYPGPRPANADTIQYTIGTTLAAQELRVINGDTDLGAFPAADAANLASTYGVNQQPDGQFHVSPQNVMWYVNLNTARPPFNNVDMRKAVNYAVDRTALALQHGALAASPTDQILPPGIPGYRDADIYPLDHTDFDKAKALAGNTCSTLGRPLKLWTFNTTFGPAYGTIIQNDLKQMGCDAEVVPLDRIVEITQAGKPGADYDLLVNGWGQDYPDPYDFLNILLDGNFLKPDNNVNLSYFNDPIANAKLEAAQTLADPGRYRAYGDLDAEIMRDYAPIVPVVNTNARIFNSSHVTGFVYSAVYGADLNAFRIK